MVSASNSVREVLDESNGQTFALKCADKLIDILWRIAVVVPITVASDTERLSLSITFHALNR